MASGSKDTVHVRLLDEGIDVWRPVAAQHVRGTVYRIADQAVPEGEVWEFGPHMLVEVAPCGSNEGTYLRVERAADAARSVA